MTVFNSNVIFFRRAQFSLGLPFKLKLYIIKFTTTNTLNLPKNFYPLQADPKNGMSSNTCPVQNSFQVTILRISRCDRPQNVHKNIFLHQKGNQGAVHSDWWGSVVGQWVTSTAVSGLVSDHIRKCQSWKNVPMLQICTVVGQWVTTSTAVSDRSRIHVYYIITNKFVIHSEQPDSGLKH